MAQKIEILLEDDLDGSPADETVAFALDGRDYLIDLTNEHAAQLRDAIALFVTHGRAGGTKGRRPQKPAPRRSAIESAAIRAWAVDNGFDVSQRGRIPESLISAYESSN